MENVIFFGNDGGMQSLLSELTDILLTHQEVDIYLKYYTPQPLSKLIKIG